MVSRRRRAGIAALLGAALLLPAGAAYAAAHDTTLVSRASGPAGASANAGTIAPPAVSADGRFVDVLVECDQPQPGRPGRAL